MPGSQCVFVLKGQLYRAADIDEVTADEVFFGSVVQLMSKLFHLTHPCKRFDDDFFYLQMSAEHCESCGGRVDPIPTPLQYYWDTEFQSEEAGQLRDRKFYWGDLLLLAASEGLERLDKFRDAFVFHETSLVRTKHVRRKVIVEELPDLDDPFFWVVPRHKITAGVKGTPNNACSECGCFMDHPRQLTRLLVNQNDIPESGVFSVAQNGSPQIFATEAARDSLIAAGVQAGFYSAGRVV